MLPTFEHLRNTDATPLFDRRTLERYFNSVEWAEGAYKYYEQGRVEVKISDLYSRDRHQLYIEKLGINLVLHNWMTGKKFKDAEGNNVPISNIPKDTYMAFDANPDRFYKKITNLRLQSHDTVPTPVHFDGSTDVTYYKPDTKTRKVNRAVYKDLLEEAKMDYLAGILHSDLSCLDLSKPYYDVHESLYENLSFTNIAEDSIIKSFILKLEHVIPLKTLQQLIREKTPTNSSFVYSLGNIHETIKTKRNEFLLAATPVTTPYLVLQD